MIKIMKIIQTIKMKITIQQTNKFSKSTIEKKFWCLYGYLWTYFTPCSSVFNIDFEHVIVHYFFTLQISYKFYKFFKECFLYIALKFILLNLNFLGFFSEV